MAIKYFGTTALDSLLDLIASKFKEFVQKEDGKGLSEENFSTADKDKLAGIEDGAQKNVQPDWDADEGSGAILNKPTIPVVPAMSVDLDTDGNSDEKTVSARAAKAYVDGKLSSTYHPVGNTLFDDLPELSETVLGNVYSLLDDFTTDERFVEGAGLEYTKGTNIAVVVTADGSYLFDVMAGFVDLSGYMRTQDAVALSADDVQNAWDEVFQVE